MLGVGGTRNHLSRKTLRGGGKGGPGAGAPADPLAQKRELLRKLKEGRTATGSGDATG
jgi:hypothetical protein